MKLSPLIALVAETFAQEAESGAAAYEYSDYYAEYDYYYDALGNKKKKKKQNKNKNNNNNSNNNYVPSYQPAQQQPAYQPPAASWAPASSWGEPAKGVGWNSDRSPLIGNGRFCWNCYARADSNGSAYANCFSGSQAGFVEMCTGEEYFCMWNERRHEGRVTEVGGGCKSSHSCLDQMTENFKWENDGPGAKKITGDQCRAGANSNAGVAFEDSVCTWCCDAMVTNRFAPTENDLCNGKFGSSSPAFAFVNLGSTDSFAWFSETNQFASLYTDGQYHRMFMIAIQTALGNGILSG